VRWCPDGDFFGDFLGPVFPATRAQHISDLRPKFALGHIMFGSMVDIQSTTAEIRLGKKEDRRNHSAEI